MDFGGRGDQIIMYTIIHTIHHILPKDELEYCTIYKSCVQSHKIHPLPYYIWSGQSIYLQYALYIWYGMVLVQYHTPNVQWSIPPPNVM